MKLSLLEFLKHATTSYPVRFVQIKEKNCFVFERSEILLQNFIKKQFSSIKVALFATKSKHYKRKIMNTKEKKLRLIYYFSPDLVLFSFPQNTYF